MENPNLYKDEMDRVYKVEGGGGGGGVHYVECHTNDTTTIQCELSAEQIINLYKSGENLKLKVEYMDDFSTTDIIPLTAYYTDPGDNEYLEFSIPKIGEFGQGSDYRVGNYIITVISDGTISGSLTFKVI